MVKVRNFVTFMSLCLASTPCFADLIVENTDFMDLGKIILSQKESSAVLATNGDVELVGAFVQGTHIKNAGVLSFTYDFAEGETANRVVLINNEMPTATIEGDGCTITFSNFTATPTAVLLTPDQPNGKINIGASVKISGFCETDTYKGSVNIPYSLADEEGIAVIDDTPDATLQVAVETDNPITISNISNMSFGTVVSPTAAGTIVLAPDGNVTLNNVTMLSKKDATAGQATVSGVAGRTIQASVSPESLEIKTSDNANSMTVDTFTFAPSTVFTLPAGDGLSTQNIAVGATLHVGKDQPAGSYTGSFTVNLIYQ
ncbi:MAG: DUF4402 domain-containing protein [Alphaproteobacteria bacterium]|nr:DUF4402 domain-containing protein [Alphaproteobacteria bacterium]